MSLRITGGRARGRSVSEVVGEGIRPTRAQVREAWFSMIGQDLTGLRFLDAFAGSGIMGLEAWSRGADVVCVERDRRHARALERRASTLGAKIEVHCADALDLPGMDFDVAFADPPYALDPGPIAEALQQCAPVLGIETRPRRNLPVLRGVSPRVRPYGDSVLHVYRF